MKQLLCHVVAIPVMIGLSSCAPANSPRDHPPNVVEIAELNTSQIRALDRFRTVVFLPVGILEEHGPYLPSYSDGYAAERMTRQLANAVAQRPGWTAVMFPPISLGAIGANEIGGRFSFPGSYTVRPETLRAVFMDLASSLGEQDFRWVFIIDMHGALFHKRALDQAAAYFGDEYRGAMVNLFGLAELFDAMMVGDKEASAHLTEAQRAEEGFSVHAGIGETSQVLYLRPDLVADVTQAPSVTVPDITNLVEVAHRRDWPGYFGAPRFATAAAGAQSWRIVVEKAKTVTFSILDGADFRATPRYSDVSTGHDEATLSEQVQNARDLAERQWQWLTGNGLQ